MVDSSSIGALVGRPKKKSSREVSPLLVDSYTLLGLEMEVEGVQDRDSIPERVRNWWSVETDNSLREGGVELVFSEPYSGIAVTEAINEFCKWAVKYARASSRTGLHVHVDVRDLTIEEFKLFCATYAICEAALYKFVGDKRETNLFCLPWYSSDTELHKMTKALNNKEHAISYIENIERYSGLNLAALRKFGSVEFRQLKTTFDFDRIILWINIILSLRKFACSGHTSSDKVISTFYTHGPKGFLDCVFGRGISDVLYYPRWDIDVYEKGLIVAQDFIEKTVVKNQEKVTCSKEIFIGVMAESFAKGGKKANDNFYGLDKWLSKFVKPKDATRPRVPKSSGLYTFSLADPNSIHTINVAPTSSWFTSAELMWPEPPAGINAAEAVSQPLSPPPSPLFPTTTEELATENDDYTDDEDDEFI